MAIELLLARPTAKVNPPALLPEHVPRAALIDLVCNANTAKLVVLSAPAGFGKTTVMSQARAKLEESGVETAWLTLDCADNDMSRFLASLTQAVDRLRAETGMPSTSLETLEVLASHTTPLVFFIDDFEMISETDVIDLVRQIIERLPRRSRIVLGSRNQPNLCLARLRGRGQLVELDTERLRFTVDDTVDFFKRRKVSSLGAEDVMRLHVKSEGWVTALWLSSITLAQRRGANNDFINNFSGSNQAVAEYLAEDVLSRQPPEVRDFLLRTSILRHLDPSICQAISKRSDSGQILSRLAAANVFVTPIAGEEGSYRYHSLFADHLRAQLAREQPHELERLHLAASAWYEAQLRPVPAIDHAIEGGDYPYALTLLADHVDDFLSQGRMRLLARWFSIIPEELLGKYPLLQVASVWATCFTRGPAVASKQLEAFGCLLNADPSVLAHLSALRPRLLTAMDQPEEVYEAGRKGLSKLPSGVPFADAVLTSLMSSVAFILGRADEARRLLDLSRRAYPDSDFIHMYSESLEGLADLQAGQLRQAAARLRMALNVSQSSSHGINNSNAWAGALYAETLYEAGEFKQAAHMVNVYMPLALDLGLPDRLISCHLMLARIAFIDGDVDQAFDYLFKLESAGQQGQLRRVVATARLERSRLRLLQGNAQGSRDELSRANDSAVWSTVRERHHYVHDVDYFELGRLRWELTFGDAAACLPRLRVELDEANRRGLKRRALKLLVLQAMALARVNNIRSAATAMKLALGHACQEGFVRLILDEGVAVVPLIQTVLRELPVHRGLHDDPIMAEYLQRLLKLFGPLPDTSQSDTSELLEPLTCKEERLLQLLSQGYSNSAMAEKLFVSDSTVRTHLRNINMKLDAHNRTQAVAIARRLGLVH